MTSSADRRHEPRYPSHAPIRFRRLERDGSTGPWLTACVLSAGSGGLFMKTHLPCPVDAKIEVELPFADGPERVHAHIAWASRKELNGVGIQFEDISAETAERLVDDITSGAWLVPDSPDDESA